MVLSFVALDIIAKMSSTFCDFCGDTNFYRRVPKVAAPVTIGISRPNAPRL